MPKRAPSTAGDMWVGRAACPLVSSRQHVHLLLSSTPLSLPASAKPIVFDAQNEWSAQLVLTRAANARLAVQLMGRITSTVSMVSVIMPCTLCLCLG